MTAEVIEFHRPKPRQREALKVTAQQAPPKLSDIKDRLPWKKALAAIWANPKNWRRSKRGNAYIALDDLDLCVVIERVEGGYQWEVRWRWSREPTVSKWIYVTEQIAINEAFDAVAALA